MKAYKIELLVIDLDTIGSVLIRDVIENLRFANRSVVPLVKNIQERDIGEWGDDHPLNQRATADAEYRRLFREGNRAILCVYCGHAIKYTGENYEEAVRQMKKHDSVCPNNPLVVQARRLQEGIHAMMKAAARGHVPDDVYDAMVRIRDGLRGEEAR